MKNKILLRIRFPLSLSLILLAGLLLRFSLAPNPGFEFDMGTNVGWARSAVELGLAKSYSEQVGGTMLPNYPPFSMMIFAAVGHTYNALFEPPNDTSSLPYRFLMKTSAMLSDILIGLLLALLVARWRGWKMGLLAAAVVAVHPAMFYESALWGQTDSIHTLFLVAALIALAFERPGFGGALFTLAFLTKAQSVALLPLFLVVFALRPRTILPGVIGGLGTLFIIILPFAVGGALGDIWNMFTNSVGYYPIISSSAYNFWWSLLADAAWNKHDSDVLFGLISYRNAGFLIFGSIVAATVAVLWRRLMLQDPLHQRIVILFSVASLFMLAFFLFMTEMHERYLFPFVALGLPVALISTEAAVLYGLISLLFFLNLLGFLPWTPVERALHGEFPSLDVLFASMLTFLFVLWMKMTLRFQKDAVLAAVPRPVPSSSKSSKNRWHLPSWAWKMGKT